MKRGGGGTLLDGELHSTYTSLHNTENKKQEGEIIKQIRAVLYISRKREREVRVE